MKAVVKYTALCFILINYVNLAYSSNNNGYKKRPSFYKHRRGPRLGRCFMDLVCDYQVDKEVKLNRLQCVMDKGPIEFKNILQTCMYNSTSKEESKEALDRLCNEPETVKKLNSCFFMAEHPSIHPQKPPLRPEVIPADATPPEVDNNNLSPKPQTEVERVKIPEANPEDNVIVKRSARNFRGPMGPYIPPPCNGARTFGCGGISPFGDPTMMGPLSGPSPMGPYGSFGIPLPPARRMGPGFNRPPFFGGPPMGHPFYNPNFDGPGFVPGPPPMMPPTGYDPFTRLVESCRMDFPA